MRIGDPARPDALGTRLSTLDYIVTRVRKHVRSASADQTSTSPTAPTAPPSSNYTEDEVEMRLSEDEAGVETEDSNPAHINSAHRPPTFQPENYARAIARFVHAPSIYAHDSKDKKVKAKKEDRVVTKEIPIEMGLKQFASLPELLRRLREDLKNAYISFVKEFVRDPHDGVSMLLDLLKVIQVAQTSLSGSPTTREQQIAFRRALIDEFECLSCLRLCLRSSEAVTRLTSYRNGLFVLAAATMSNLARSRTISLQLLAKTCECSTSGHLQVLEAFSTLRLRYSEPVRCKFLISMMLSHPHPSFQIWGLRFINALVSSATTLRQKVYLQEEIMEAGFDPAGIKKALQHRGLATQEQEEAVNRELNRWSSDYVDLSALEEKLISLKSTTEHLQEELKHLRQANMKLLEENVLLKAVGGEVQDRCQALQRRLEHHGLPSAPSPDPSLTDSEVSSFATAGRSTIKRNRSPSPSRQNCINMLQSPSETLENDGTQSLSSEWSLIRTSPEVPHIPPRSCSSLAKQQGKMEERSTCPVPQKRSIHPIERTGSPGARLGHDNESFVPDQSLADKITSARGMQKPDKTPETETFVRNEGPEHSCDLSHLTGKHHDAGNNILESRYTEKMQTTHLDEVLRNERNACLLSTDTAILRGLTDQEELKAEKDNHTKNHIDTQSDKHDGNLSKHSTSCAQTNKPADKDKKSVSLCSSISSLSSSSSGPSSEPRKDPPYENFPIKDGEKTQPLNGNEEAEIDYERDMIIYEAITLGNDTIEMDSKTSTQGSDSSKHSSSEKGSVHHLKPNSVKDSVTHYENLISGSQELIKPEKEKTHVDPQSTDSCSNTSEGSSTPECATTSSTEHMEGAENDKAKYERVKLTKKHSRREYISQRPSEKVRDNKSKDSAKTNSPPPLSELFEDRASPEQCVSDEIEIVPTRMPQMPRRQASHNSPVNRNVDPVLFLECESPAETSDTETSPNSKVPGSPRMADTESTNSFGWVKGDHPVHRNRTYLKGPTREKHDDEKKCRALKRSESLQTRSDYNSHRSYSPRRRGSVEILVPLEENEVHISGRKYTQYTAQEVEKYSQLNDALSKEIQRHKAQSIDERLNQWLDGERQGQRPGKKETDGGRHLKRKIAEHVYKNSRPKDTAKNPWGKYSRISLSKSAASAKTCRRLSTEMSAFNGFRNPSAGLRESDYGSNFMLNSPSHHILDHYGEVDISNNKSRGRSKDKWGRRRTFDEVDIPTPDYSATPAGTISNGSQVKHILDIPSGLY